MNACEIKSMSAIEGCHFTFGPQAHSHQFPISRNTMLEGFPTGV
jgi:hypothetical protein